MSGPRSGRAAARRRLGVPQLDREEHRLDRADRARIVGDAKRVEMEIALGTLEREAALAQGREMAPAGEEMHLLPGRREACAEIAPDPARRQDRNAHGALPYDRCCVLLRRLGLAAAGPSRRRLRRLLRMRSSFFATHILTSS